MTYHLTKAKYNNVSYAGVKPRYQGWVQKVRYNVMPNNQVESSDKLRPAIVIRYRIIESYCNVTADGSNVNHFRIYKSGILNSIWMQNGEIVQTLRHGRRDEVDSIEDIFWRLVD